MNEKTYAIKRATALELLFGSMLGVSVNLFTSFSNYFTYYLTDIVGIGVMLASSFITIFRIWDAVTDFGMGYIVDRTNTRYGKFRPWIAGGTIASVITSWLLINIPAAMPEGAGFRLPVYIVLYMLFVCATTVLSGSVRSTAQVLTDDSRQRAAIGTIRGVLLTCLYSLMPVIVYSHIIPATKGFNIRFFRILWTVVAAGCLIFSFFTLAAYRRFDVKQELSPEKSGRIFVWKDTWDMICHNRPFQMLILSAGTDKLATTCQNNATVVVILFAIVCGNSKLNSAANQYALLPQIAMIVLGLGAIGRKFGAKRSMVFASWGGIATCTASIFLWIFGNPASLSFPGFDGFRGWTFFTIGYLVLWCLMKGFNMVSSNVVNPLIADVIDYEQYRSGRYCPGMVGSIFNLADKCISSLGPAIIGILLALAGFGKKLPAIDTPFSSRLFGIGLLGMYGLVIAGLIVNLIAFHFYDLTPDKMAEIRKELNKRNHSAG